MSIKDILVVCDAGEANDYRVETALLLAKIYEAHVTGLHLTPYPVVPIYGYGNPEVVAYTSGDQIEEVKATAEELKSKFVKKASEFEVPCEWSSIEGIDTQFIVDKSRYADIVVLPQGYSRYGEGNTQKIDDFLSINLGRPLMIIPDLKKVFNLPKRVVIAWNESHEAARAVHDALPLLTYTENVEIVSVSKNTEQEKSNMIYSDDLRKHLSHHGINATVISLEKTSKSVGDTILQSAIEYDADLIVMGAYGHTRFKEIVLGGATRDLLRHTTIPLLLSH